MGKIIARVVSLIVAVGYLVAAYLSNDIQLFLLALLGDVISLGLIWFGDEIGSARIPVDLGMNFLNLSKGTPGIFLKIMGWVFLLFPVIIFGLGYLVTLK